MQRPLLPLVLALVGSLPAPAQGLGPSRASAAHVIEPAPPGSLPLLGDGAVHLYVQEAYEGFSPGITAAVDARYDELVAAGMDCARHLFDWADLEPAPGVYDLQPMIEAMDARQARGIEHQFCNLVVIDSFGPVVPPDVEALLAAGVTWDDPRIASRLLSLIDAALPLMLERDMYMLGLANEPGGYYEDDPLAAASFQGLLAAAVQRAHQIEPELACTVVFAGATDAAIASLMPLIDVASFNQYAYAPLPSATCLLGDSFQLELYQASAASSVGAGLDALILAAQGRLVCIQEFGQSTGWSDFPVSLGPLAGLRNQAACMAALRTELEARSAWMRSVCLWNLNDHTPAGMQYVGDELLAEVLPACLANNVMEIFGPCGIVRSDVTASEKPAFAVVRDALRHFAR